MAPRADGVRRRASLRRCTSTRDLDAAAVPPPPDNPSQSLWLAGLGAPDEAFTAAAAGAFVPVAAASCPIAVLSADSAVSSSCRCRNAELEF